MSLFKGYGEKLRKAAENLPNLDDSNVYAFLGDAIYEVYVRLYQITENPGFSSRKLGDASREQVKATFQAQLIHYLEEFMTEQEKDFIRTSRNQCKIRRGGNFSPMDYRLSTALEAMIGRLFLTDEKRFEEWMEKIGEYFDEQINLRA